MCALNKRRPGSLKGATLLDLGGISRGPKYYCLLDLVEHLWGKEVVYGKDNRIRHDRICYDVL